MGKKWLIWTVMSLSLAAVAIGVGWLFSNVGSRSYTMDTGSFVNTLMGYAPRADSIEQTDAKLRYVDVTWRELEPEEGEFDWEYIEEKNNLLRLKSEGVHLVLRFACDIPDDEEHMDIPDWLYERTGDGTWYDTSYGKGYSPDYSNSDFIKAHQAAIAALAEYFDKDGFASYVELGSLGHWGEWHIKLEEGIVPMPVESIRDQYVQHYLDSFENAKLLMRRPFNIAADEGLGLYNDMTGHEDATLEWFDWIENGGDYSQTMELNALTAMPDAWKTAPIGGEMTSSLSMKQMLKEDLSKTLELIEASHMTFLGPKIADDDYEEGYEAVLGQLGYKLWVSKAKLMPGLHGARLTLTWRNDGNAPFYWDWSVYVYVLDEDDNVVEARLTSLKLSELMPGEETKVTVSLNTDGLFPRKDSKLRIAVGIVDPMNGDNAVRLAMETETLNGMTVLFD